MELKPLRYCPLSEDEEIIYCRVYLEEFYRLGGRSEIVSEKQVNILHALTKLFQLVSVIAFDCSKEFYSFTK